MKSGYPEELHYDDNLTLVHKLFECLKGKLKAQMENLSQKG